MIVELAFPLFPGAIARMSNTLWSSILVFYVTVLGLIVFSVSISYRLFSCLGVIAQRGCIWWYMGLMFLRESVACMSVVIL